jgi:hypothetical protein
MSVLVEATLFSALSPFEDERFAMEGHLTQLENRLDVEWGSDL